MGNAPSQPPPTTSSTTPRSSTAEHTSRRPRVKAAKSAPGPSPPVSPAQQRRPARSPPPAKPPAKPTPDKPATDPVLRPNRKSLDLPGLRPNRKSIDLPGLNNFAAQAAGGARNLSGLAERGRQWLHREGSARHTPSHNQHGLNGYGGRGRGSTPPRSAAIAIPGRSPHSARSGDEEAETGYGYHARAGIARRKAEHAAANNHNHSGEEEERRGRSRDRSRGREREPTSGLRAPSPSRSQSHSRSHSSASPQRYHEVRYEHEEPQNENAARHEKNENEARHEHAHAPAKPAYAQEIVYSTIPLTIGPSALIGAPEGDGEEPVAAVVDEIVGVPPPAEPPALQAVPITWRGPGAEVFLIRAGDGDWTGRRVMERESPTGPFTTTVHLPPGTHHFRFIVDGQTVTAPATDIPNAVDDQGFIANYVAVPGPAGTTPPAAPTTGAASSTPRTAAPGTIPRAVGAPGGRRRPSLPMHPHPDGSFWSARSSVGSTEDVHALERAARAHSTRTGRDGAVWTSVVPEALVRAAAQEEAFLDALAQQQAQGSGSRGRPIALNGFVPEPSIPPAPRLPRHLERLILNRPSPGVVIPRVGTVAPGAGSAANAVGTPLALALRVTTASGTDVSVPLPSMTAVAHANANANADAGEKSSNSSEQQQVPPTALHPQFGSVNGNVSIGGGASTTTPAGGASAGVALIADDPSVLQTPSHAVLYHLCTSSIRDGMIAVGASTRYRQKYLTTVYYKPANPGQRE